MGWALFRNLLIVYLYLDNEVDGDSLMTLVGMTPEPDCLKELVLKIGIRMKIL